MSAEPGGIGSKLGSIYERRFATELCLQLTAGRITQLKWEPHSGQLGGADIDLVRANGILEHVQLKRQNASKAKWSVATLHQEGVLSAAAKWLAASNDSRFTFVSSDPVPHLKDICDQLLRSDAPSDAFLSENVDISQPRRNCFASLLTYWGLNASKASDRHLAIQRLQRMAFVVIDRSDYELNRLQLSIQLTFTGDPVTVQAAIEGFLESKLNQSVTAEGLIRFLLARGFSTRNPRQDLSAPVTAVALRTTFTHLLQDRFIHHTWIARPQTRQIVDAILGPSPPRLILIHGKAGYGKSAVICGVCNALVDTPVLPLSLVHHPPVASPFAFGKQLGFTASPVAVLRAISGDDRAVLILDQFDSLRLISSQAAIHWNNCHQLIREAMSDPKTTVVIACRTFDLENDPNIRKWHESLKSSPFGEPLIVEVGALEDADVEAVVKSANQEPSKLSPRMRRLLRHPNTLDMWSRLVRRGRSISDTVTASQLFSQLITELREEAVRNHLVSEADVSEMLNRLRVAMESSGSQTVPKSQLPDRALVLKALISVGLLIEHSGAVSLPHQSYLDHLIAAAAIREAGDTADAIVTWTAQRQTLARRDQLRQLLLLLRDEQNIRFVGVADQLLSDARIRFHLKQLTLAVLHDTSAPSQAEIELVVNLSSDLRWREHVRNRVIGDSEPWFDALHGVSWWNSQLAGNDFSRHRDVMFLLRQVAPKRPNEVDSILVPLTRDRTNEELLLQVLAHDPADDSPLLYAWRLKRVRRGDMRVRDYMLDKMAERNTDRAVKYVLASIRAGLHRALREGLLPDHKSDFPSVSDISDRLLESFRRHAKWAAPRLLRMNDAVAAALNRLSITQQTDRYSRESSALLVLEALSKLIGAALGALASSDVGQFTQILRKRRSLKGSAGILKGLLESPSTVADQAVAWLLRDTRRLKLKAKRGDATWLLARDVIAKHGGHCSRNVVNALQRRLLRFFPPSEKQLWKDLVHDRLLCGKWGYNENGRYVPLVNRYGWAQYVLLSAIDPKRRLRSVQLRLQLWENKFGPPKLDDASSRIRGGHIRSPIPPDRSHLVSDKQWRKIARTKWTGSGYRQVGPHEATERTHQLFSRSFGDAAKLNPARFTRLAASLPASTPSCYFEALWSALSDDNVSLAACNPSQVEDLLLRSAVSDDRDLLKRVCDFLRTHAANDWSDKVLAALKNISRHVDPLVAELTSDLANQPQGLESIAMNSVRGSAGYAIGALLQVRPDKLALLQPAISQLAIDSHPAVRVATASVAAALFNHDHEAGIELLLRTVLHPDDRVLGGHLVVDLLAHARWRRLGCMNGLLVRMINSSHENVAEQGSFWLTAERFQQFNLTSEYASCRHGTIAHRKGVFHALSRLLTSGCEQPEMLAEELASCYVDDAPDIHSLSAEHFRDPEFLKLPTSPALMTAFTKSPAFLKHVDDVLWGLDHTPIALSAYQESVLAIADRTAECLKAGIQIDGSWTLATSLGSVLLKLYDSASKGGNVLLSEQCLDRWDKLLQHYFGDLAESLDRYDG